MRALLITFSLFLAAPAMAAEEPVTYGCDEMVVIGRLENLDYEHVELKDDLLGHGWMNARIHVRSVVKGADRRRVLPLRYFGHTYLRHDRTFMLVLSPQEGAYGLTSATMLRGWSRPKLEAACRPAQPAALP